ncbi:tripartite tricarboxylate transporter TctB family protein [Ramlibacter henchirensis]|uniref:Tripartite tricarboxylate transporter TctB family protein n=1 Tax=Ramlibacter henchirensis TaxID=204072 RepID=A0A4Z0CBY3_9BURK|nr:tripartite tricarboxylate transporter TctB family protein [Ramlibacter henchirensis]TFZ07569.1 tripartite tricarboxylate transporter TctB family protein [Ramlibacter henchirensis]
MSIRNQKDFAAGLIYVLAGAGFSLGALEYRLGDPARMGPGFFPFWVGVLLAIVGLLTLAGGVRRTAGVEGVKRLEIGPMAWILGGVVLFGLLLQPLGLVLALTVLVLVSSRASHEFTWRGALINAAALVAFSTAVFIHGINLQIPLWPVALG